MNEISLEWVVDESAVSDVVASVEEKGGRILASPEPFEPSEDDLYDMADSAFEPMMVVAVALSVGALIKVISEVTLAHKYPGGDVIDIRGGTLKRRSVPSLDKGSLVVVMETGTEKFSPAKRADGLALLEKALMGMANG
jgi:hypothetical protein